MTIENLSAELREILTILKTPPSKVQLNPKVNQQIYPCICPFTCSSKLGREKLRQNKKLESLIRRCKIVDCHQVDTNVIESGMEILKRIDVLKKRQSPESEKEMPQLETEFNELSESYLTMTQKLDSDVKNIEILKKDIESLEKLLLTREKDLKDMKDLILAKTEKFDASRKDENDLELKKLEISEENEILSKQLMSSRESRENSMKVNSELRQTTNANILAFKEIERSLIEAKEKLEVKIFKVGEKSKSLSKLENARELRDKQLSENLLNRENKLCGDLLELVRKEEIVRVAERISYTDNNDLEISSLEQEIQSLNLEISIASKNHGHRLPV